MKIAICEDVSEDEVILRSYLSRYAAAHGLCVIIDGYNGPEEFLLAQPQNYYDIIFLNIFFTESHLNGIELAVEIRDKQVMSLLVFVSDSTDYAYESYDIGAVHYLLKPIAFTGFSKAMNRCVNLLEDYGHTIYIKLAGGPQLKLWQRDIMYIESFDRIAVIHTQGGTYQVYLRMKELSSMLDPILFVRVQRSYIVNLRFIQNLKSNFVVLKNGMQISLGRSLRDSVKKKYQEYLQILSGQIDPTAM